MQTPLYEEHVGLGAKMAEFAGWQVPMIYSSVSEEHKAVRNDCGIFDVSHMGEVMVEGEGAEEFIYKAASNDISKLTPGKAQYSLLLNKDGGVVDDVIFYKFSNQKYLICLNASNAEKDFNHLQELKSSFLKAEGEDIKKDFKLTNLSSSLSQIAVQGPKAVSCLEAVLGQNLDSIKFFSFSEIESADFGKLIAARTGYTGEDGFEVFLDNDKAVPLWQSLLKNSAKPIGFAARDTLRLEAALPLYGHELTDEIPALSSNVSWAIKLEKDYFLGKKPLEKLKDSPLKYRLKGLEMIGKGVPRESMPVYFAKRGLGKLEELGQEEKIGWVTSGTKTPSLDKAVALSYIETETLKEASNSDSVFYVESRGRLIEARVSKLPFYKRAK